MSEIEVQVNRDFKGIWIPREIWLHPNLSLSAKCLWAEIHSLYNREKGGCYASDEYLCKFLGVKIARLHQLFTELKQQNLLIKVSFDGRRVIRKVINPSEDGISQPSTKVEPCFPEKCNPDLHKTGTLPYSIDTSIGTSKETPPTSSVKKKKNSGGGVFFDRKASKFQNVTEEFLTLMRETFPGVDIQKQLRLMKAWLLDPANPHRDGGHKFITNWLTRHVEKNPPSKSEESEEEFIPDPDLTEALKEKRAELERIRRNLKDGDSNE